MRSAFFFLCLFISFPAGAQFLTGYYDTQIEDAPSEDVAQPILTVSDDVEAYKASKPVLSEPISDVPVSYTPFLTRHAEGESASALVPQEEIVPFEREAPPEDAAPIDFQAEQLDYDEANNIITASGDVFLEQSGRILRADRVIYDLNIDRVQAEGHVVLNEINGDVFYSDAVEFKDQMKDGVASQLSAQLQDGSRFAAESGRRSNGQKTVMRGASFTSCEACEDDPEKRLPWQIKAGKVTHNTEEQRIAYNNATFEVLGVPALYLPYFSHPDGSVKQESGFLTPVGGFRSAQGFFIDNSYYWGIAPDHDATIGMMAFTSGSPLVTGQWRKRWANAEIDIAGGITNSDRFTDDDYRGHILGNARWHIDENWRAGANIEWASDDQYMREYDFSNEAVLTTELYVERFTERDYIGGRMMSFKDTRVGDNQQDQPRIFPEIVGSFKGDVAGVPIVGGQWSVDSSYLGMRRDGEDQDYDRFSVRAGWDRRLVSDYGLLTDVSLSGRQDLYYVRDRDVATDDSGLSSDVTDSRFIPRAHIVSSYPMMKDYGAAQLLIEPVVAFTATAAMDDNDIPNEDSQDVQLDINGLFDEDRFPGLDQVEDRSRITYGLRTGLYNGEKGEIRTFIGQSYRLEGEDNPFQEGSGLNTRSSDVVGEISGLYKNNYQLNYRFQLDSASLKSERHEVDAAADFGDLNIATRYLYSSGLAGTALDESREQLRLDSGYYWNERWQTLAGLQQDLGENPGLRQAYLGFNYYNQCVFISLIGQRNFTADISGENNTEILFRIGLRNIGEFMESQFYNR